MQHEQDRITELDHAEAAIAVRRDIQAVAAARNGELPRLGTAISKVGDALHTVRTSELGDDERTLYRNLIDVAVAAEGLAVRLRAAHPDLTLES